MMLRKLKYGGSWARGGLFLLALVLASGALRFNARAVDPRSTGLTNQPALRGTNSVFVTVVTNFYRFGGTNHSQMRAAMKAARPWKETQNYDALTKWDVHAGYRIHRESDLFKAEGIDVKTRVVITLPWWVPGKPVPRELVDRWNKCVIGLNCHEQGHLVLGEAAGAEVRKRLLELPACQSPQELTTAANNAINEAIELFRARERKYDEVTKHGFTQGAVFPMNRTEATLQAQIPASP